MAIKDLFEKPQQVLTSEDAENVTKDKVESLDNLDAVVRQKEEFVPYIDHSSASNFAIYGSAEKYYEDALTAIYRQYPYDGSSHEKKEYELNLNYLTRYILDKRYPRTNGYISLATNATFDSLSGSYGGVETNEYIEIVGGPHTASSLQYGVDGMTGRPLHETFKYSNKLASDPYSKSGDQRGSKLGSQLSNLRFNPEDGMTVEFWLKKDSFDATKTKREVIFDLWNGETLGATPASTAGRLLLELTSAADTPSFRLTYRSGSTSVAGDLAICDTAVSSSAVAAGAWNHYALSVKSDIPSNETVIKFYVNGDLNKQTNASGYINEVTGALKAHIGALQTGTVLGGAKGSGLLMASLDEFRYWKEARTSEQIGRYWWSQVDGGSNTETPNTTLGVYYKFNEGIVQSSSADTVGLEYDKKVLDYSGRVSNGVWVGYPGYGNNARSTNSAMVEANVVTTEFKDPILYNAHTKVKNLKAELKASGSVWDDQNNASLLNALPTFMREEDESIGDGSLTNTLQMMGSYFDKLHHLIEALPKIRATSYLTASAKPYPFATHLLESIGLNSPELFVQANVLESLGKRDEDREYTQDLTELKNLIYHNIYNNLTYVYKSKGTEKSIRNIIRCFGVDEELIRLNLYASNLTYELKDNIRTKTVKSKSVNFNDVDKFDATIYQAADPNNPNTTDYITGSGVTTATASLGHEELLGMTAEGEFIFPIKLTDRDQGYFRTPFTEVSLFGMHTPTKSTLAFDTKDYANFQVSAVKSKLESNHVYFRLTSSFDPYPIPELTSSMFTDVYDNQRWNISVRIKPITPVTNFVQDNQTDPTDRYAARVSDYEVHFYGVNMETGYAEHTFHLSASMEAHHARDFLRASKKIYAGAHKTNFNGGILQYSDVKVSNIKYWATCLENEDLNAHASDAENYGIVDPYKNISLQVASLNGVYVPKIDTLALNWTFDNCVSASSDSADPSSSDSYFFVDDVSSGSAETVTDGRYSWLSNIVHQQHSGKGDQFLPPESGDRNPIDVNYISSARRQLPEVLSTKDAVQILRQDDDKFTREHSIVQHYYAIEKSMYQTISEEMINMFASIVDFNNLIGEPVNRYRQEYKDLSKLRQLFFERIGNTPNLDRYIEFYKWVDSAIITVIQNLIPASAEVSDELHNMVESHVLERNKYWTKFPTIEFKQDDPEAGLRGIQEMSYSWKHGHRPVDGKQSSNALYWKDRAERNEFPLSVTSSAGSSFFQLDDNPVDGDKNQIRKIRGIHREAKSNSLTRPDGTSYGAREYSLRRFTKPYELGMNLSPEIRSGINFERGKNVQVAKNILQPGSPLTLSSSTDPNDRVVAGVPTGVLFVDGEKLESFKDVNDNLELNKGKRKHKGTVQLAQPKEFEQHRNETYSVTSIAKALPATIVSSSVVTGYNKVFAGVETEGFVTGTAITNIHHDFYGQDREIPLQGPFTEKYVGGHQSRHVRLNPGTDTFQNRPEAWRILIGKCRDFKEVSDPKGAFGFVSQDYPFPVIGRNAVQAQGSIKIGQVTSGIMDGKIIILDDGTKKGYFQYNDTAGGWNWHNASNKRTIIDFDSSTDHATNLAASLVTAVNNSDLYITAVLGTDNDYRHTDDALYPATVYFTNNIYGTAGSIGNKLLGSKGNTTTDWRNFAWTPNNTKGVKWTAERGTHGYGLTTYGPGSANNRLSSRSFAMDIWVSCSLSDTGQSTLDNNGNRTFWAIGRDGETDVNKWLYRLPQGSTDDSLRLRYVQKHVSGDMTWTSDESLTSSVFGRPNGGWYHIVVSYNHSGNINQMDNFPLVYINGVSASTDTSRSSGARDGNLGASKTGSSYNSIGFRQLNSNGNGVAGTELYGATIASMAYWDDALTRDEMVDLYNTTGTFAESLYTEEGNDDYDVYDPRGITSVGIMPGPTNLKTGFDNKPKYWWRFGEDHTDDGDDDVLQPYDSGQGQTDGFRDHMYDNTDVKWFSYDNVSGVDTRCALVGLTGSLTSNPIYMAHSYAQVGGGIFSLGPWTHAGITVTFETNGGSLTNMTGGMDPIILNYNAPKATRYREELIKRPVNFKNIRQTTASADTVVAASRQHGPIGNYTHNYEIVQSAGRSANDLDFRKTGRLDHEHSVLAHGGHDVDAVSYRRRLLQREISNGDTEPPTSIGNPNFWHRNAQGMSHSSRDSNPLPTRTKNKTVIVSRFSAPGGYEVMSRGFLDPAHEEYSTHNAMPWRNRAVRGDSQYVVTSGSVGFQLGPAHALNPYNNFKDRRYGRIEGYDDRYTDGNASWAHYGENATTFRVVDIHGEPWGLRSHLARYTAPFGRDSVLSHGPVTINEAPPVGSDNLISDHEIPGYHKVHRNRAVLNDFTQDRALNNITTTYGVESNTAIRFTKLGSGDDDAESFRLVNYELNGMDTQEFTVALWVYHHSLAGNERCYFNIGNSNSTTLNANRPICFLSYDGNEHVRFKINNRTTTGVKKWHTASGAVSEDTLHSIIITYDGSNAANDPVIYIDGEQKSLTANHSDASATMNTISSAGGIWLGGGNAGGTWRSTKDTSIFEAAIWNSALNATSVAQIYARGMMPNLTSSLGGHPRTQLGTIDSTESLVSWWRMGDHESDPTSGLAVRTSGSLIYDVKGTNNVHARGDSDGLGSGDRYAPEDPPLRAASHTGLQWMDNFEFYTKSQHDNWYVQHQIPRNHSNYSWVTASLIDGFIPAGLPTSSDSLAFIEQSEIRWSLHLNESTNNAFNSTAYPERAFWWGGNTNERYRIDQTGKDENSDGVGDYRYSIVGGYLDFVGLNHVIQDPINTKTNLQGWTPAKMTSRGRDGALSSNDAYGYGHYSTYINNKFIRNKTTAAAPFVFCGLIHHRQGPYGWPSWKQIRGGNHPIIRAQKRLNEFTFVLPDADELHISSSSGHMVIQPRYGKLHHWERITPVTSKFKPIESTLGIATKIRNSFGKETTRTLPIDINTTYGNELVYFNRPAVDKELDLSRDKVAAYDEVKAMFTKGALETSISPVTEISKFVYKETIYPASQNMYMGDVRIKKGYTQNFWRPHQNDRILLQPKTIHGQTTYGRSRNFDGDADMTHFNDSVSSVGVPAMSVWPLDHATGAMDNWPHDSYTAVWAHGDTKSDLVGKGEGELMNRWTYPIKWTNGGHYTLGTGYPTASQDPDIKWGGTDDGTNRMWPEACPVFAMPHLLHSTSSINSPTGLPLVASSASVKPYKTHAYHQKAMTDLNTDKNPAQAVFGIRATTAGEDGPSFFLDGTTAYGIFTTTEWFADQIDAASSRGVDYNLSVLGLRDFWANVQWNMGSQSPLEGGNTTMMALNKNANFYGFVPLLGGYVGWQANELAGKLREITVAKDGTTVSRAQGPQSTVFETGSSDPWFGNYEQFYNDIKYKAKDYSVLPEFRMEDHMEDYINNKSGDYLAEQNSLFRMVGMPSGSDSLAANSSEDNFYKIYGTTDFLKHFDVLKNDIEEHFAPSSLTLQCNAVIKFNPYDGFYPAQRTLQLARQFSASYGRHVNYTGPGLDYENEHKDDLERANVLDWQTVNDYDYVNPSRWLQPKGETAGIPTNLAFRNFLSPLYAPGIMFNTIKAGIACDWPVYTDGEKMYKTRVGKSDYWGLGFRGPEADQELHDYFDETYGKKSSDTQAEYVAKVNVSQNFYKGYSLLKTGIYKIRDDLRKSAITQSLIVQSASIAGISDGFRVITPDAVFDDPNRGGAADIDVWDDDTTGNKQQHQGGFYATKINVGDLPGIKETTYTMNIKRDPDTLIFNKIEITASMGPGPNLGTWDKRIPFEAIINPENYLKNIDLLDYVAHPSCSMDVTASWQGQGDNLYSLMANNFCAAVPDFFLQGGNMTSIASRPQDELSLYAEAGKVYGMRIKMYRSLNRERDYSSERATALRTKRYEVPQDPRDDHGLHETFTMYSRASAFGPPILGRTHCLRNTGSIRPGAYGNVNTTAEGIMGQLTASYDMKRADVFADTAYNVYTAGGTDIIGETLFHTSSYLASTGGVLDSIEGYYWSHTPPYYHGEAWCDVLFKPQQSKTFSLAEILDQVEVKQWRVDPGFTYPTASSGLMEPRFIPNGFHSSSLYSAENINNNAMQLDSSLNLFGIGKVKTYAYTNVGATGRARSTTLKRTVGDSPAWIIQPKFETPMLNFNSLTPQQGGTCPRPLTEDLLKTPEYGSEMSPRGIWHQFGTLPQGDEGVWLEVGDIPQNWLNNHPAVRETDIYAGSDSEGSGSLRAYKRAKIGHTMKSLAEFVGMDTTPRRLGALPESQTVYEAVCAVPFIEKDNQRFFFTIDPQMIDVALGEESYRLEGGADEPGTSIKDQVSLMQKYVLPPQFDFLSNRTLPAVAMYIFEFSMTFDKDDLSYIWQNLMPTSAKGFQMSKSTITHSLLINELMGYASAEDSEPLKDKIKWMVFKAKQRAPTNYYDKIIAKTPELDRLDRVSRSKQVQLGSNHDARYSYNWPYDCFSIVEMANIEATIEFSALPASTPSSRAIDKSGGRPSKQGRYGPPSIPGTTPAGIIQGGGGFGGVKAESETGPTIKGATKLGPAAWNADALGNIVGGAKDATFAGVAGGLVSAVGAAQVNQNLYDQSNNIAQQSAAAANIQNQVLQGSAGSFQQQNPANTGNNWLDAGGLAGTWGGSGPIMQQENLFDQAMTFDYGNQGAMTMNAGQTGLNQAANLGNVANNINTAGTTGMAAANTINQNLAGNVSNAVNMANQATGFSNVASQAAATTTTNMASAASQNQAAAAASSAFSFSFSFVGL